MSTPTPLKHFLILGSDKPGVLAVRQSVRETHRAHIRETSEAGATVVFAGPTLDAEGQMNGSLLVVQAPSKEAVEALLAADPYSQNAIFAKVEIREMRPGLVRTDLLSAA